MEKNRVRQLLEAGQPVFGTFNWLTGPECVEIMGAAGFDFVVIDMEHGPHGQDAIPNLLRAADAAGVVPIVRVTKNEPTLILRSLDLGARGLHIPQVNTAAEAAAVVKAARYWPLGERGFAPGTRAARFGSLSTEEYIVRANADPLLIIHIENKLGVENLDEILAVPGIDVIFIGPADLSQSLGIPGKLGDPRVIELVDTTIDKAKKAGRPVGIFALDAEDAARWVRAGVTYIALGADSFFLFNGAKALVEKLAPIRNKSAALQ
ncbi:MAG: 2-dehydro-3-deoxyglucarate aldolase [Bacillota bacterium]|jgi:4-hydroxy-2-oxoheptanedioate aldolase|nr:2-dehydro-3-deoxyglucarate aldolase [Bacillota bacterium]MDK2881791.1 2-dehydro-3-deoxyglucarate aldolase [Bacillota bacterium]MDK2960185.1 2-dehydro-3-deoxyglucarate aldolase [Bacillota bacterium]